MSGTLPDTPFRGGKGSAFSNSSGPIPELPDVPQFELIFAPYLIGWTIEAFLTGIIVVLTINYFVYVVPNSPRNSHSRSSRRTEGRLILVSLVFSVIVTIINQSRTWDVFAKHAGNVAYLYTFNNVAMAAQTLGLVPTLVNQIFFLVRATRFVSRSTFSWSPLSRILFRYTFVGIVTLALIAEVTGCLVTSVITWQARYLWELDPRTPRGAASRTGMLIGSCCAAGADILVSCVLITRMWSARRRLGSTLEGGAMIRRVVKRLTLVTVHGAALQAILQIGGSLCYIYAIEWCYFPFILLPKVYSINLILAISVPHTVEPSLTITNVQLPTIHDSDSPATARPPNGQIRIEVERSEVVQSPGTQTGGATVEASTTLDRQLGWFARFWKPAVDTTVRNLTRRPTGRQGREAGASGDDSSPLNQSEKEECPITPATPATPATPSGIVSAPAVTPYSPRGEMERSPTIPRPHSTPLIEDHRQHRCHPFLQCSQCRDRDESIRQMVSQTATQSTMMSDSALFFCVPNASTVDNTNTTITRRQSGSSTGHHPHTINASTHSFFSSRSIPSAPAAPNAATLTRRRSETLSRRSYLPPLSFVNEDPDTGATLVDRRGSATGSTSGASTDLKWFDRIARGLRRPSAADTDTSEKEHQAWPGLDCARDAEQVSGYDCHVHSDGDGTEEIRSESAEDEGRPPAPNRASVSERMFSFEEMLLARSDTPSAGA